jgi:hypothetical protein
MKILILVIFCIYCSYSFQIGGEVTADLSCGLTDHFNNWLKANGYGSWDFPRSTLKCGSYGGKASDSDPISHNPIVFIHGNSDVGYGRGTSDGYLYWQTGFRSLVNFLADKGYSKSEMYITTWGVANGSGTSEVYHAK